MEDFNNVHETAAVYGTHQSRSGTYGPFVPRFNNIWVTGAFIQSNTTLWVGIPALCHKKLQVKTKSSSSTVKSNSVKMDGQQEGRGHFFSISPYTPPSWATHLGPIPSHYCALGHVPTPIHRWNLPGLPANTEVWIKRDDLSGMQLSGNKVRKLEFLMADAKAQGADCIITIGSIQSNHCRATAVAARYLNLDCYLILRTTKAQVDEDPGLTGNLLVERMVGASIELVSKEEHARTGSVALCNLLKERLIKEGRKPYTIPVGGSNSLGTWGYIEAVREIEQQLQEGKVVGVSKFDDIVVACGRQKALAMQ